MHLALKIDVDTLRGTREGVPTLVELLRRHDLRATFLFSLGPDHTGRAIKRVFRPGFIGKVRRTSVVRHYGVRTLLYGTLLPGPDIGRRAADVMRAVRDAGHETGIHCWDHIRWQDGVARADERWTYEEMRLACDRYTDIFGEAPRTHGAAGWQMNRHALRLTPRLGFDYCSDGRGTHPYLPIWNAEPIRCPQFPTTLPTLDELVGTGDVTEDNVAAHLLERTSKPLLPQVYTLHAELEGMRLAPVFEQLLLGWKAQGWTLGAMRTLFDALEPMALPRCTTGPGTVPGRTGTVLVQGPEFLADVDRARAA
ncbi:MAG: 4-deoxy-4-formamido-L-arabinose-phosphoundecaprenol deformylase [Burkholderiales bacterium]|nr:4-deoxy-4-formamido-L-arabinose-phosphoundecaprenol deformylase [Burkholderiales bacterium]